MSLRVIQLFFSMIFPPVATPQAAQEIADGSLVHLAVGWKLYHKNDNCIAHESLLSET